MEVGTWDGMEARNGQGCELEPETKLKAIDGN